MPHSSASLCASRSASNPPPNLWLGGDAPEAPSHTRGVCVFVSSLSSSFVVVVVVVVGRVARRASRAARPHEEPRRAAAARSRLPRLRARPARLSARTARAHTPRGGSGETPRRRHLPGLICPSGLLAFIGRFGSHGLCRINLARILRVSENLAPDSV